jgi:hypothetical protein
MAHWTDLLEDAAPIKAIFGDAPPSLRGVDLHEVVVSWDGPSVSLRLDTAEFPASPPPKWSTLNTVQLTLEVGPVETMSMSDVIPRTGGVDLDIRREPLPASETLRAELVQYTTTDTKTPPRLRALIHLYVLASCDPILKLKAHSLYLKRISAYLNGARPVR